MFWKIIGTALCSYLLFKGIGMMMLSLSFLIDGELARYSSVFRDRFTKRYFIKSDTVNLLMNFSLCLWCVICLLEIWNIFIFNETFLVLCLVLGILISMFSFNINYTIADVLHGMVTNFKVIEDLPEDVQETYGNARKNIEQAYYLPLIIGIVAILHAF